MAVYKAIKPKDTGNDKVFLVMGPWHHGQEIGDGSSLGALRFGSDTALYFRREILRPFERPFSWQARTSRAPAPSLDPVRRSLPPMPAFALPSKLGLAIGVIRRQAHAAAPSRDLLHLLDSAPQPGHHEHAAATASANSRRPVPVTIATIPAFLSIHMRMMSASINPLLQGIHSAAMPIQHPSMGHPARIR